MRSFTLQQFAVLIAASTLGGVDAFALPNLPKRELGGLGIWKIYDAVKEFLKDKNAWDWTVPEKCNLYTETTDGSKCYASVDCSKDDLGGDVTRYPADWNVCYLGGQQWFDHPKIGHFSITFTKAGGVNGDTYDGLHSPVFTFDGINSGEPMNVDDIITAQGDRDTGRLCRHDGQQSRTRSWLCGIPILERAASSAFGIANVGQNVDKPGYEPGWCTAHVIQYQKNEFGNGPEYSWVAQIFDGKGDQIAKMDKTPNASDRTLTVRSSPLPYDLVIHAGAVDSDPAGFCYADQCWTCDGGNGGAHLCTLGDKGDKEDNKNHGWENGDREGNMGFTC